MSEPSLPTYLRPPVVETILSAQFSQLAKFTNAHLGAFWRELGSEWPSVADASPVDPQFERFSEEDRWRELSVKFRISAAPVGRLQIRNLDQTRMIQVQSDRFLFNWLGSGGGEYPRYDAIRAEFARYFDLFRSFIHQNALGDIRLSQWEVTYLNHIPRGDLWESSKDWTTFCPSIGRVAEVAGLTQLESFGGQWHYLIPQSRGRLHVNWQHGKRSEEKPPREIVVLTLTARGPVEEAGGNDALFQGFDLGRRSIVLTFRSMMSDAANHHWGLQDAGN